MKLRLYLFNLYLLLFISAGFAAFLIYNTDPFQSPFWVVALFYVAVFLFFLSLFGLIGFYAKVSASNREIIFAHLKPTLRQAAFIGLLVVGLLFFQQLRVLNWWVALLYIIAILFAEIYFKGKKHEKFAGFNAR